MSMHVRSIFDGGSKVPGYSEECNQLLGTVFAMGASDIFHRLCGTLFCILYDSVTFVVAVTHTMFG